MLKLITISQTHTHFLADTKSNSSTCVASENIPRSLNKYNPQTGLPHLLESSGVMHAAGATSGSGSLSGGNPLSPNKILSQKTFYPKMESRVKKIKIKSRSRVAAKHHSCVVFRHLLCLPLHPDSVLLFFSFLVWYNTIDTGYFFRNKFLPATFCGGKIRNCGLLLETWITAGIGI